MKATPRDSKVVVLEIGAGTGVPTIRWTSEQVTRRFPQALLIRYIVLHSDHASTRTCATAV